MRPGFYLKCGMHWTGITFGIGNILLNVHSADPDKAIRFDSREQAQDMAVRCSKMKWGTPYDVVQVVDEEREAFLRVHMHELKGMQR